ncbi:MAG TPA: hypothetical protein VL200_14435 [Lacunisphaera sp.]|jgi:hypothetical protein|nr:hypothetical protein [Lacunisphaera sp.]
MRLRLLLVAPLVALTGCSSGSFHLTQHLPWHKADKVAAAPDAPVKEHVLTTKEKKVRAKFLQAEIKEQELRIRRYKTQDPANKMPDAYYFVSDVEYAEAQERLAKDQTELKTLVD